MDECKVCSKASNIGALEENVKNNPSKYPEVKHSPVALSNQSIQFPLLLV